MSDNVLVREIMTKPVKVVREDTNLQEVIATLSSFDIDSIVVVQGKRPVGIITSRDALIRGFEQGLPAREIKAGMVASAPVITIDQEASLEEATDLMRKKHIKHLAVISNSELVGIISAMDIVFAMPSMLHTMEEVCRR
ncbi:CBS domain-containing protein [Candidatus Bathycorpusculum sp.]|uniref:CBS domain-containing protein n=1 Tax=Candidatus Bathycorpusculum sp. TaxID=2994959 RepID=UPI00281CB097|nr:CBS domain-containing protein [Candidatus Termitimicrobium sp.]MCL2685579.1 CBS domain-containing protein [Candidatus Termitimicrobium sp.]